MGSGALLHQGQLGRDGIHRVHHIVIGLKVKGFRVFRQEEAGVGRHLHIGVDLQDPGLHGLYLQLPNGFPGGNDLPVQVGQAHPVVIHQVNGPQAAADQGLADIAPNAPNAKHGHTGGPQTVHGLLPKQQFRSGKLIQHRFLLNDMIFLFQIIRRKT